MRQLTTKYRFTVEPLVDSYCGTHREKVERKSDKHITIEQNSLTQNQILQ